MDNLRSQSLQRRLHDRLQQAPDGRALAFFDQSGDFYWRSFGEVYDSAMNRATFFAEHGLRPGDVCILIPENDEFSTTSLLAILVLGAVPVLSAPPIVRGHHSNLNDVLKYLIRKTRAKAVIASENIKPLVEHLSDITSREVRFLLGTTKLDGYAGNSELCYFPAETDVAVLQLTSGTTGFPKVCVWKQLNVLAALTGMAKAMMLTHQDVCVNWTPLYHDMGLVNNFLLCMVQGVPLALLSTFDFVKNPAIWLNALSTLNASMTWSPNFGFAIAASRVKDPQIEGIRLDSVRAFWNAAERIHLETIQSFYRRFSAYGVSLKAMKTNFGQAENVGGATFSDCEGTFVVEELDKHLLYTKGVAKIIDDPHVGKNGSVKAVSVGRPYPGMSVKIISRTCQVLPDGQVGEIALDTPSRMSGYLGDVRSSKRVLVESLLRTGDLGYQRKGEVFWLGRLKELLNLNGKKFDTSDFEKALLNVYGVRKGCFAVFSVDDTKVGTERLVIVAEKRNSSSVPDRKILREIAGSVNLHLGVKPSVVFLLGEGTMTKTSSGKRRHRYYRDLYMKGELSPVAQLKME